MSDDRSRSALARARRRTPNPIPPEQRDALEVDATADLLSISRRTVYTLIATGELDSIKIRGKRLIPRTSRLKLIERKLAEHGDDER